ncbi:MAG: N-acetylmuramoyl-L-alanine amidase [Chloroflexi bacterium]|nr:MAG: N-acetylmuramoyl-L-alanine amidase [Chloroflexota bacterium]
MHNDDEQFRDSEGEYEEQPPSHNEGDEVPASVAFMEIMRQAAAAKSSPERPADPPDPYQPPPSPTPPSPSRPPQTSADAASPAQSSARIGLEPDEPDEITQSRRQEALEIQRIRRIQRRKARRRYRTFGVVGSLIRTFIIVAVAAGLIATILAWGQQLLPERVSEGLSIAQATATSAQVAFAAPTGLPTPNWLRRIGIVSGHRGPEDDPGAVCPDGLTEAEINFNIAQLVVRNLRGRGFSVDLLDEFDPRLDGYQAAALLSIHSNTCQDFGAEIVSGYLIAQASARPLDGPDNLLVDCVAQHYEQATGLQQREGVTRDMSEYHTFGEIHPDTAAAIIELGFMLADRALLTGQPDVIARGLTDGILCFLQPGNNAPPPAAPTPDAAAPSG